MKVRRGSLLDWQTANPTLLHGEIGLVHPGGAGTEPEGFIFGNGSDDFATLWAVQAQRFEPGGGGGGGDMTKAVYDSLDNGTVNSARVAYEVAWADVTGQPVIITEADVRSWWGESLTKGQVLAYDDNLGQFVPVVSGDPGQVLQADPNAAAGVVWVSQIWGDMFTSTYDPDQDGVVVAADVAYEVDWADVTNKPATIGDMLKSVYDTDDDGVVDSAEREQLMVINKTGATLTKGTIVYLKTSSSSANYPEALKASATTEMTSSKTLGAVLVDINNNDTGFIVTSGQVHNLDTSAYNVGDRLWLSATAGQVTTTPPASPAHAVFIGFVTRKQNVNGRVHYSIQNGYELAELHDVAETTPIGGDVLTYNSTSSLWEPQQPAVQLTLREIYANFATF